MVNISYWNPSFTFYFRYIEPQLRTLMHNHRKVYSTSHPNAHNSPSFALLLNHEAMYNKLHPFNSPLVPHSNSSKMPPVKYLSDQMTGSHVFLFHRQLFNAML